MMPSLVASTWKLVSSSEALAAAALPVPALPVPALPAWQISYGSQPPTPDPYAAEPWQRPVDWLPLPAIQPGEQKLVGFGLQEATRIVINRMSSHRAPSTLDHAHQHDTPAHGRTARHQSF